MSNKLRVSLGWAVAIYMLAIAVFSAVTVVDIFPQKKSLAVVPVVTAPPAGEATKPPSTPPTEWERLDRLEFDKGRFICFDLGQLNATAGLVVLALLAGVIGACLHGMNSLANYQGNGDLQMSWMLFYFLRPPIGAAIGFLLYFIVRAGFLNGPEGTVSPYGVVAFSGLGGLCADRALEMFRELFKTLFNVEDTRKDKLSPAGRPVVTKVAPVVVPAGSGDVTFEITGKEFGDKSMVKLGDKKLKVESATATQLKARLAGADRPGAGEFDLVVINPPDRRSAATKITLQ